jgi:hypothetical protein
LDVGFPPLQEPALEIDVPGTRKSEVARRVKRAPAEAGAPSSQLALVRGTPFALSPVVGLHGYCLPEAGVDMDRSQLMELARRMFIEFKDEFDALRAEGASQTEIDAIVDEFEELYSPGADAESDLVMAVLRQAARPPK